MPFSSTSFVLFLVFCLLFSCLFTLFLYIIFLEVPLNITDVRLNYGYESYEGVVQFKVNDQWGYMCYTSFDDAAGKVVCNMLGYQ
jgi:hypothetical protein